MWILVHRNICWRPGQGLFLHCFHSQFCKGLIFKYLTQSNYILSFLSCHSFKFFRTKLSPDFFPFVVPVSRRTNLIAKSFIPWRCYQIPLRVTRLSLSSAQVRMSNSWREHIYSYQIKISISTKSKSVLLNYEVDNIMYKYWIYFDK